MEFLLDGHNNKNHDVSEHCSTTRYQQQHHLSYQFWQTCFTWMLHLKQSKLKRTIHIYVYNLKRSGWEGRYKWPLFSCNWGGLVSFARHMESLANWPSSLKFGLFKLIKLSPGSFLFCLPLYIQMVRLRLQQKRVRLLNNVEDQSNIMKLMLIDIIYRSLVFLEIRTPDWCTANKY